MTDQVTKAADEALAKNVVSVTGLIGIGKPDRHLAFLIHVMECGDRFRTQRRRPSRDTGGAPKLQLFEVDRREIFGFGLGNDLFVENQTDTGADAASVLALAVSREL